MIFRRSLLPMLGVATLTLVVWSDDGRGQQASKPLRGSANWVPSQPATRAAAAEASAVRHASHFQTSGSLGDDISFPGTGAPPPMQSQGNPPLPTFSSGSGSASGLPTDFPTSGPGLPTPAFSGLPSPLGAPTPGLPSAGLPPSGDLGPGSPAAAGQFPDPLSLPAPQATSQSSPQAAFQSSSAASSSLSSDGRSQPSSFSDAAPSPAFPPSQSVNPMRDTYPPAEQPGQPSTMPSSPSAFSAASSSNGYSGANADYGNAPPGYGQAAASAARNVPAQPVVFQSGGSTLRAQRDGGQSTRGVATSPAQPASQRTLPQNAVTTGEPFVSAPRQTGNFPTSPYNPRNYQLAAYQRGIPSNARPPQTPGQLASTATAVPGNQALSGAPPGGGLQPPPNVYNTSFNTCPPGPGFPSTGINGSYAPATVMANQAPNLYVPNNAGWRPLFTLGQDKYNVQLGRGLVGQPTTYVPGQHIRNFLRYIFP